MSAPPRRDSQGARGELRARARTPRGRARCHGLGQLADHAAGEAERHAVLAPNAPGVDHAGDTEASRRSVLKVRQPLIAWLIPRASTASPATTQKISRLGTSSRMAGTNHIMKYAPSNSATGVNNKLMNCATAGCRVVMLITDRKYPAKFAGRGERPSCTTRTAQLRYHRRHQGRIPAARGPARMAERRKRFASPGATARLPSREASVAARPRGAARSPAPERQRGCRWIALGNFGHDLGHVRGWRQRVSQKTHAA
jgi:hypothetical protein